jgi:flagellar biosynthesis protein FlhF
MRLKLFHAPDMAEAMAMVRATLGADALILSTRQVPGGVQITAALEQDDTPPPLDAPSRPAPAVAAPPPEPLVPELHVPVGAHAAADQPRPDRRPFAAQAFPLALPSAAPALAAWAPPRPAWPPGPAAANSSGGSRQQMLRYHRVPAPLHPMLLHGDLAAALAAAVSFAPLPYDRPLLLAGPPGAGKTLTIARLATRLVLAGLRPLVITADGQRAGATEQLAAFTRLLGIDLIVADTPPLLIRAMQRRGPGAPALIDCFGIDPLEQAAGAAITDLAEAAAACLIGVLPAGIDPEEAADLGAALHGLGATHLIATRLDLARRLGSVLAAAAAGLRLAEAGIGPGAADGLIPATPALLAERLARIGQPA